MYSCFCQSCNKIVGEYEKKNNIFLCPKCKGVMLIFTEINLETNEKISSKEEENEDNDLQKMLNDYFLNNGNI